MIKKITYGVIVSIILIFILAIFTNGIKLLNIFPNKVTGSIENWIGFYATIIAGILTLSGVLITIDFNKNQIQKEVQKEKLKEDERINLKKIKLLWDLEMNLDGLNRDLLSLKTVIQNIVDNTIINESIVNEGFSRIVPELNKFKLIYNERKLQIKSAEIDLETYRYIMEITKRISDICDTLETVKGPGSDELVVFINDSNRLLRKIDGMLGVTAVIVGVKHKIIEKRETIESKHFNI